MSENSYHSDIRERVQQRLNVLLNMTAEPSKKTLRLHSCGIMI